MRVSKNGGDLELISTEITAESRSMNPNRCRRESRTIRLRHMPTNSGRGRPALWLKLSSFDSNASDGPHFQETEEARQAESDDEKTAEQQTVSFID